MRTDWILLQAAQTASQESVRAAWWAWVATLVIVAALGGLLLLAVMRGLRPRPVGGRKSGRKLRPVDAWALAGRRLKPDEPPRAMDDGETERGE